MEQENFNQDESQIEAKSFLHEITPFSKYLAMTLFVLLPFVGGYVGYHIASDTVITDVYEEPVAVSNPSIAANSEEYPFVIENVVVNAEELVLSSGDDVYQRYQYPISWDYKPGSNGDPANAYITATIVDANDNQVMWLKNVGVSEYKIGSDTFSLGSLCSVLPTEGCIKDESFSPNTDYRVKIVGANCKDHSINPGYCADEDREPIKPAYSNWFKLSTSNLKVRSFEESRGFSIEYPDDWRVEATEQLIQIFNYADSEATDAPGWPDGFNKIEGGFVVNLNEVSDLSKYDKASYAGGVYYRQDPNIENEARWISVIIPYQGNTDKALRFTVYGDPDTREQMLSMFLAGLSFN